jgi:hypothetical protein
MHHTISRRQFVTTGVATLAASAVNPRAMFPAQKEGPPAMLDHILLGCSVLDRGIDFVAQHTGVRATFGGVHPGRGTQNALLSLGEKHYLEIIAPDPEQPHAPDHYGLQKLTEPRLVTWAAHPGRLLQWKTLTLKDNHSGLLPFFIEWSADTVHPSADAPSGCKIDHFSLATPADSELRRISVTLGLGVSVSYAEQPQVRARIEGPGGKVLTLSS